MNATGLKSLEFRRRREASWAQLERLVAQVERKGIGSLSAEQLARLPMLYRAAASSLSVARAISLDKNVVDYLDSLAGRAFFCVYGTKRRLFATASEFLAWRFPRTVRRYRGAIALAALVLALGAVASFILTGEDMERYYAFVPDAMAQGRNPTTSTEALRASLYHREDAATRLAHFATFLFTHNARVGILAFALGFAAGAPTLLLVFYNGLLLGAFAALFHARGLSAELWAWLLPHGVTELLAVSVAGGAGLVLAWSLVFPGRHTRLQNLALRGREAGVLVVGAVVMLFVAALVEGIFRQTVHSVPARYGVALLTLALWALYFTRAGREAR